MPSGVVSRLVLRPGSREEGSPAKKPSRVLLIDERARYGAL